VNTRILKIEYVKKTGVCDLPDEYVPQLEVFPGGWIEFCNHPKQQFRLQPCVIFRSLEEAAGFLKNPSLFKLNDSPHDTRISVVDIKP